MRRQAAWEILGILICLSNPLFAHELEIAPRIGAFVSAGYGLNSIDGWSLDFDMVDIDVPPDMFVACGIVYGPWSMTSSSQFYVSGELGKYSSSGTSYNPVRRISGKVELNRTPVMTWFTMTSKGKFGPLFRIGVGASKINFSETYTPDRSADVEINYWSFGLGFGGGLFLDVSDQIGLLLNVDGVIDAKRENASRPMSKIETGLQGLAGFASLTFRVVAWF